MLPISFPITPTGVADMSHIPTLMGRHPRAAAGFSLVELMVAMVAGMIVSGAVLAFVLSSVRVNSEYVRATRLTIELRNSLNLIAEDLRRAGYDEDALKYVAQSPGFTDFSPFSAIEIINAGAANGCIVYAYDRLPANPGALDLDNGEVRAFRRAQRTVNGRQVGVIEFAESDGTTRPACDGAAPNYASHPAGCNAGSGWCALSDPTTVDITSLSFNRPSAGFYTMAGAGGSPGLQIREVAVDIQGRLVGADADPVQRGVNQVVRVRADCVRTSPGTNCISSP